MSITASTGACTPDLFAMAAENVQFIGTILGPLSQNLKHLTTCGITFQQFAVTENESLKNVVLDVYRTFVSIAYLQLSSSTFRVLLCLLSLIAKRICAFMEQPIVPFFGRRTGFKRVLRELDDPLATRVGTNADVHITGGQT